jgi:probable addiction module antidote protein
MATKKRVKETFSRYDTADYLKSGDDAAFIAHALGNIARARGMAQLAKDTGLTREGLYKALNKDSNPSFGTILKVMKALGLKLTPQAA